MQTSISPISPSDIVYNIYQPPRVTPTPHKLHTIQQLIERSLPPSTLHMHIYRAVLLKYFHNPIVLHGYYNSHWTYPRLSSHHDEAPSTQTSVQYATLSVLWVRLGAGVVVVWHHSGWEDIVVALPSQGAFGGLKTGKGGGNMKKSCSPYLRSVTQAM